MRFRDGRDGRDRREFSSPSSSISRPLQSLSHRARDASKRWKGKKRRSLAHALPSLTPRIGVEAIKEMEAIEETAHQTSPLPSLSPFHRSVTVLEKEPM